MPPDHQPVPTLLHAPPTPGSFISPETDGAVGGTADSAGPAPHRHRRALSVRARLTLWNVAILSGSLFLFSISLYGFLAWSLDKEITDSLAQQYNQIRDNTFLAPGLTSSGVPGLQTNLQPDTFGSDELDVYVQITLPDGSVLPWGRSSNLKERFLPRSEEMLAAVAEGGTQLEREVAVEGSTMHLFSGPLTFTSRDNSSTIVGIIQVARSLERTESTLSQLRLLLIGGGLASLLIAAIAGFALSGAALAPLDRLAQAVRDIGASRDFSQRVPHAGPDDEVGQLTHTFNEMLAQLQAAHNGLATALETQRRFVADASHELRTPLTTIRGNVGLLRHVTDVAPGDRDAALADIDAEAERMTRLVSQMLSLARADAGLAINPQPVALDAIVREVGRQLALLASPRDLRATTGPVEPARVLGNADALKQLLLILVDNAIKYTPAPGSIRLQLTRQAEHASIQVTDTGMGIGEAQLPHIFERFYRADPARGGGGAGLGLAIARWLANVHGGCIEVDSAPGQGSTFRVLLPLLRETA